MSRHSLCAIVDDICRFGPHPSIEEEWAICERLMAHAKFLVEQQRYYDAALVAGAVGEAYPASAWTCNAVADVLQWSNWQNGTTDFINETLSYSRRGQPAFASLVAREVGDSTGRPFFIAAFVPKSGGTFIARQFTEQMGYREDIYFCVGSSEHNRLCSARVQACAKAGGVFNHVHLYPSVENQSIVRESELPFWVHARDPRDCFLSLVNMIRMEGDRSVPEAQAFYRNSRLVSAEDAKVLPLDAIASRVFNQFEYYCQWLHDWLSFDYRKKLLTHHEQLIEDNDRFFADLTRKLGIGGPYAINTRKDFDQSRFFKGTNGRWSDEFSPDMVARMNDYLAQIGLSDLYPLAGPPKANGLAPLPAARPIGTSLREQSSSGMLMLVGRGDPEVLHPYVNRGFHIILVDTDDRQQAVSELVQEGHGLVDHVDAATAVDLLAELRSDNPAPPLPGGEEVGLDDGKGHLLARLVRRHGVPYYLRLKPVCNGLSLARQLMRLPELPMHLSLRLDTSQTLALLWLGGYCSFQLHLVEDHGVDAVDDASERLDAFWQFGLDLPGREWLGFEQAVAFLQDIFRVRQQTVGVDRNFVYLHATRRRL